MPSSASVPARFADRRLETFRPETPSAAKALDAALEVVSGEIANLVLMGPTGVGKTHLAAAIVRALSERLIGAYQAAVEAAVGTMPALPELPAWLNIADAIVRLRLEMDAPLDDRETTLTIRRLARHRGLLVLDDLGRERVSDWTAEIVYSVVNTRYEARLGTLVTTNLSGRELARSPYWPALSRLAEDGLLVEISAPDRRLAIR